MTDFKHVKIIERIAFRGPGQIKFEIELGKHRKDWFSSYSYEVSTGEGGGSPCGFWPDIRERFAHPDRETAIRDVLHELRRLTQTHHEKGGKYFLRWFAEVEHSLDQPDLFAL